MAITFPTSPSVNQVFTSNGSSWSWNGNYWQSRGSGIGTFNIPTSYLVRRQSFTATGSSANFTLTVAPNSVTNLVVYVAGIEQPATAFSLSGAVVTLTPTPAANAVVDILDFSSGAVLGAINRTVQNFVATDGQTLILSAIQFVPALTDLFVNGILQSSNQYTAASSGYSVTMLYGLAAGDQVRLVSYTTVAPDPVGFVVKRQNYLVASTQTVFTVAAGYRPGYIDVYVNGVRLIDGVGFTAVDGQTLTLASAATTGQRVEVQSYVTSANQVAGTSTSYYSRKYTGDGSTTTFLVSTPLLSTNSVLVFKNGLLQLPVDDYSVVGSQVVFVTAPALNAVIHIRELPV